ncbi:hypothetical protein GCM10017044_00670 [Kordiimonas sediminis]|uniref:HTH cro/C1-type domain-containing protein n=1 Tax=Kordiimonas sediminis TaxID=1735581 RepID=A0A919E1Q4_9PROT|nr:helix-turn-helix domain-containing protein [Kordiimonas sediminis]GHF10854.1 hypothetical protein GCM10017044_00670 [Kordiimonas sediminis]
MTNDQDIDQQSEQAGVVSASDNNTFGKYLKFWRTTKKISQEQLAYDLNCSSKHISFLENGHTRPSQNLILRISTALQLAKSDTNHLLIAGGFRPLHDLLEDDAKEREFLNQSLSLLLQTVGAAPALIRDRIGNIKMMNRACVVFWQEWLGDAIYDPDLMNIYRLAFSERGWRPYLLNWPALAQKFMTNLKQELLLEYDPEAEALLEILATQVGIEASTTPDNLGDIYLTKRPSILLELYNPEKDQRISSLICTSTVGSLSQNVKSSLILEVQCPYDYDPPFSAEEIAAMDDVRHPLLPY